MNDSSDTLAGEAYVVLRERILRGELAIGTVVSRRKLATELGMSLVPVSEAFQRLEFEGLVESRPRAGTRVKIPTEEDVRGHYVVRSALEAEAARLFADVATTRERLELQKLAVRVDTLSVQAGGNRFQYLSLHEKLHRKIAQGTRCERLVDAIEKNHVLALTWLCGSRQPSATGQIPHVHQDLIEIVVGSSPMAAAEAMRVHIQSALQNTLHRLEPYFERRKTDGKTFARSSVAAAHSADSLG
jgi:DNA-binding GntR family transcriptional regulator